MPEYDETDPSDTITEAPAEAEPAAPETAATSLDGDEEFDPVAALRQTLR